MLPLVLPIGVIVFPVVSLMKKQMLPEDARNAISPFLNSDLARSVPESMAVSRYRILDPNRCAFPSNGNDLVMIPTVLGDR